MWPVLVSAGRWLIMFIMPKLLLLSGAVAISTAVYTPILNWLQSQITSSLSGMGQDAYQFLQFVGVPQAVSIILAAMTMKIGLKAARSKLAMSSVSGKDSV